MFMMDISIVGFINQLRIFGSPWGPHLVLLYLWGLLSLLPEWWQYLSKKRPQEMMEIVSREYSTFLVMRKL
jgi:hypothetical protein